MNEIKHIVFDIGNVLIKWDVELAYLDLIPDQTERRWFLENVCTASWNIEQDRGRPWTLAEDILIQQFPEHEENIRAFRKNWPATIEHKVEGTDKILKSLIAYGHDVTFLTNFAADTFKIARAKYELLNISRGITVSGEVGLIKPDIKIYRLHAEAFDISPPNALFIDDSAANVDGAKEAGWQAVLFKNAKTLKGDLERFQIDH